ncbi:unnamed protein product [Arabis nemorensis]|uniref:Uncharacterized protein n=1 Tax=Arabis nemorensis TaxID=586526 RepID=A0A565AWK8_9BRAS|nr:unnamed protein product [Arabis nemorensis]
MDSNNGVICGGKLDKVATWVSSSAFFTSLERFACLNLTTTDPDDDRDLPKDKDRPLFHSDHNV